MPSFSPCFIKADSPQYSRLLLFRAYLSPGYVLSHPFTLSLSLFKSARSKVAQDFIQKLCFFSFKLTHDHVYSTRLSSVTTMSPPSILFLLSLLPVALTLVLQPKSYPTGLPASHHINGHLSNHTGNKTHSHPHPSFTPVPLDFSNRTLVDALNFGLGAGQKIAHRNCTNLVDHDFQPSDLPAWMSLHASGIPHATATIHSSSTPLSGALPSATAPASEGGEAIGRRSPQSDGPSTRIHPQTDDPIALQNMGMQDPSVVQAYALGMKIGKHRCSLPASASEGSTHPPGTNGTLPPTADAKMEVAVNDGALRYFDGKHDNGSTHHARTNDDALRYVGGKHEQKRGFWSDLGHLMTGHRDEGMGKSAAKRAPKTTANLLGDVSSGYLSLKSANGHDVNKDQHAPYQATELEKAKRNFCMYRPNRDGNGAVHGNQKYCVNPPAPRKREGPPNNPEEKVSQGSATNVQRKNNHPKHSAATSSHPPRSLPRTYLLLLGFSMFVSLFSTSMAAGPALDPPPQTTGLVERVPRMCFEWGQRFHGHAEGGPQVVCWRGMPGREKRSGNFATTDKQESGLLPEAEESGASGAELTNEEPKSKSTLYCPGGTSNTCSVSAAKGFRPPRFLVGTYILLLTSLVLTTHVIPYAAAATAPIIPLETASQVADGHPNAHPPAKTTGKEHPNTAHDDLGLSPASSLKKRQPQANGAGGRLKSATSPVPKPSRTLLLGVLLLFTFLFTTARAAPVDEMRHSHAPAAASTPQPLLAARAADLPVSLVPTPTPSPRRPHFLPRKAALADEMRLSLMAPLAAGTEITPRSPVDEMRLALLAADADRAHPPPKAAHWRRDTSPTAQKAVVGTIVGIVAVTGVVLLGLAVAVCVRGR